MIPTCRTKMALDEFVPDATYGRGCDLASIRNRTVAYLYEKKSCRWDRRKASEALGQLDQTKDDLRISGRVEPNCAFMMMVVRVKDDPHCSTDGDANALVEAHNVRLVSHTSDEGRSILRRMDSLGAK